MGMGIKVCVLKWICFNGSVNGNNVFLQQQQQSFLVCMLVHGWLTSLDSWLHINVKHNQSVDDREPNNIKTD